MFAGLDPGTTVAYCVLDIDGRVVKFGSSKNISIGPLIKTLSDLGRIIVVGTDKGKVPYMVKTIATKLGSICYVPKEDIAVSEKITISRQFNFKNSHERDAIAAALLAYASYSKRIKEIKSFLDSNEIVENRDIFIEIALKKPGLTYNSILDLIFETDEDVSAQKSIDDLNNERNSSQDIHLESNSKIRQEEITNLRAVIKSISRHNMSLATENKSLKAELQRLSQLANKLKSRADRSPMQKSEKELMEIISFKERRIQSLSARLSNLENDKIELTKKISSLVSMIADKDKLVLAVYPNLLKLEPLHNLNLAEGNMLIFVLDPNVFSENSLSFIEAQNIMIISPERLSQSIKRRIGHLVLEWDRKYEILGDKVILKRSDYEAILVKRSSFSNIVSEYQEMRRKELLQ